MDWLEKFHAGTENKKCNKGEFFYVLWGRHSTLVYQHSAGWTFTKSQQGCRYLRIIPPPGEMIFGDHRKGNKDMKRLVFSSSLSFLPKNLFIFPNSANKTFHFLVICATVLIFWGGGVEWFFRKICIIILPCVSVRHFLSANLETCLPRLTWSINLFNSFLNSNILRVLGKSVACRPFNEFEAFRPIFLFCCWLA